VVSWLGECLLFDPVCDNNTKNIECEFNSHELTTGRMLGSFGSPNWYDGIKHSGAPSVDETSADHPNGALSRSLKGSADDGPCSSQPDCLDTSIAITEGTTNKTPHKSTKIVDGDDAALKERVVDNGSA